MDLVKRSEYARRKSWAPSYVTKLIKAGVVVLTEDGKLVDAEASDRNLEARQSLARQGLREYHAQNREARGNPPPAPAGASVAPPAQVDVPLPGAAASAGGKPVNHDFAAFNAARAKKEQEQARIAEMDRLERERKLVDAQNVSGSAAEAGAIVVRSFMSLEILLEQELGLNDEQRRILRARIYAQRTELAGEFGKLADQWKVADA